MKKLFPVVWLFSCLIATHSFAGSATWSANPVSNDWNTAANWVPTTVPNGPGDVATFSTSSITNISLSGNILLSQLVFAGDAAPYNIAVNAPLTFTLIGPGIANSSSQTEHIDLNGDSSGDGTMSFLGSSSAGSNHGTIITAHGGTITYGGGGAVEFHDTSSAGSSTLIASAPVYAFGANASITFFDHSTAATATFSLTDVVTTLTFTDSSTADQATISAINHADVFFSGNSNAGSSHATIATVASVTLGATAYAGPNASITVAPGGVPCSVNVYGKNDVPIETGDEGYVYVGDSTNKAPSVGSIAGDGLIILNQGSTLTVGSNNLSTEYTGAIINDPNSDRCGGLAKVGTGTLTLSEFSEYCLGTTVNSGVLLVKASNGAGYGPVKVTGGTLGGRGTIAGNVTLGSGSGPGAVIAPSQGSSNPTMTTIQKMLFFKADGSYLYRLNTNKGTADQVIANGVKIENDAQFNFKTVANKKLTVGTVFTAISNTATTPINGTFANLADGSMVTVGANKLQVSYSGGDGNDLTLTVVE